MSSRNSDVSLIIKARDEASKTLDAVNGAMNKLFGLQSKVADSASETSGNLGQLAAVLGTLDKAYSSLTGGAERAEASFNRQKASIAGQREELRALQAQATSAQAALQRLNGADAIVNAGRDQSGRLAQIKTVQAEYDRLSTQVEKLARSIATQESGLNSSTSSLQKVASTANAVEAAVAAARREIELQSKALRDQAAAAQVAANVQKVTGVGRTAATDSGASFEALANREIQLQEQRARAAREAAAAVAESVRKSVGLGSGRATDNGATFSALASREEAAALKEAEIAHKQFEARVRQGTAAMAEAEREEQAMAAAAAQLRAQLDPVANLEARLATEQGKLNALFKSGKISADELSAGMKLLRAQTDGAISALNGKNGLDSRGRPSLFGLKPYELTNLGYQVNDVVTQLASGTSLTQTLAQQGGQLLQLFPRVGSAIVAALGNPVILAGAAAIGAIAAALNDAYDRAERLRKLGGLLDLGMGNGGNTAQGLNAAAEALDHYGLTAEKAVAVVRILMKDGFDETQIVKFGKAAQDMADILGIEVTDAAKQMADAFDGGYESILKIGKATDAFTLAQYAQIKALFDAGKADQARQVAADILTRKLDEVAQKANGPWSRAARNLSEAWDTTLASFANSGPIQALAGFFEEASKGAVALTNNLKELGNVSLAQAWWSTLTGQPIPQTTMPNSLTGGKPTGIDPALFKNPADNINAAATAAASKAADEAERQARAEEQVTNQKQIQKRLDDLRIKLREQALEQFGKGADPKEVDRFVDVQVDRERLNLNKQLTAYLNQQADAAERARKAAMAFPAQAAALLKQFEGFSSKAYWDRNAFRVGFGSDTITRPDGTVQRVTSSTTTTRDDATRDLERRITEFANVVKQQIGSERFGQFSTSQQAALTSIAYNYGKLPDRIIAAVKTGTSEQIAAAVRGLAGDNKGVNAKRRGLEADLLGAPNLAVEQGSQQAAADLQAKQEKFNQSLREEAAIRQTNIDNANAMRGLSGEALIDAQREAEVQKAITDAKAKAARDNLTFSKDQEESLRRQVQLEFEATKGIEARAKARRDAIDNPVADLQSQRDAIQSQMDFLRGQGAGSEADSLQPMLDAVNAKLKEAIANAIAFYQALKPGDDPLLDTQSKIDAIITRLQTAQAATTSWINVLGVSGQQIAQVFASQATSALNKFAQAVAEGKNVFSSLKDAFLTFASQFLQQIAQMIMQAIIFNIVASFLRAGGASAGGGGGGFGSPSSLAPSGTYIAHTGGIIGRTALLSKPVAPTWAANATRYHTGGIAGLRPDEVPTILQRGEEVLTSDDPRHRLNGGAAPNVELKVINTLDASDMLSEALSSPGGSQALFNHIRANKRAFREATT